MPSDENCIDIHNCDTEVLAEAVALAQRLSGLSAVLAAQMEMAHFAESENTGLRDLAEHMRDHAVRTLMQVHDLAKSLTY